jgi:hypothetical protein
LTSTVASSGIGGVRMAVAVISPVTVGLKTGVAAGVSVVGTGVVSASWGSWVVGLRTLVSVGDMMAVSVETASGVFVPLGTVVSVAVAAAVGVVGGSAV